MDTECTRAVEAVNKETKQLNPEPVAAHQLSKQSKQAGSIIGVVSKATQRLTVFIETNAAITVRKWVILT